MPALSSPTAPGSSPWAALLPAALAGTARTPAPPNLPGLTPSLGAEAGAAEKQLLLTAASLRLVQRAGQRPSPGPADSLGRAPAETWPVLPAAPARLLAQAAAGSFHYKVMQDFTNLLTERRLRLPHYLLPRLVERQGYFQGQAGWNYGARGLWLGTCHPNETQRQWTSERLASPPPAAPEAVPEHWLLTVLPGRQDELRELLARHPWPERGPLPMAYEPVLEQLRAQGEPRISELLLRLDGGARAERYWAHLAPLLEVRPDPTGPGGRRLHVTLPSPEWQASAATQDLLPAASNISSSVGTWLQALRFLSPTRLAAAWGLSEAEVLELGCQAHYAEAHRPDWWSPDPSGLFVDGMYQAALFHQSPAMALAVLRYLRRHPDHPYADKVYLYSLLPLLPAPELLAWAHSRLPTLPAAPLTRMYRDTPYVRPPWLTTLTPQLPGLLPMLLPFLRAHFSQAPDSAQAPLSAALGELVDAISGYGDLDLLPWLEAELLAAPHPPALRRLLEKARLTLQLRRDFAALLPPPAAGA